MYCSLLALHESNAIDSVDPFSRLKLSHSHHAQHGNEHSLSFEREIKALDRKLWDLDARFVYLIVY